jgi:flavin reductase (DIM6/NTAB) family NADH-FMN oxidoreductase RutF
MADDTAAGIAFDPRVFRDSLGHYASGITVISSMDDRGLAGFTCQSFYSVSVDPPLVSFSVMASSTTYPRVRSVGRFAVSVLAHDQQAVSNQFARRNTDKWSGVEWVPTAAGNPVIAESLIWLDCTIWAEHEAGDHYIVIGRVDEISPASWRGRDPLIYFRGEYRHLHQLTAPGRPRE